MRKTVAAFVLGLVVGGVVNVAAQEPSCGALLADAYSKVSHYYDLLAKVARGELMTLEQARLRIAAEKTPE